MGMVKLIHSSSFDPTVGAGAEIIRREGELTKQASTIFGMDYDDLKPDDKSVGIHVVALGDAEHYGMNRNGDLFTKKACQNFHDTFVKNGHVFRHHRNKDPEKAIGIIKASAYNEPMGRIELFIHADKEKAAPELERLEKEGEIPVSMACFRAGAPVFTREGVKPIESIRDGDLVLTHECRWRRVSATMSRVADGYCKIRFISWGNREFEVTPNHLVLAASFDDIPRGYRSDHAEHPDKGWRRRHRADLFKYAKWIPAGSLTSHHYLCVPKWDNGPGTVGVDRARLYGYYIAEGSLSQGTVTFTCNVNDVFVDEIPKLANWTSTSKRKHKLSPDKCVVVSGFGTDIRDDLERSCGRRCENKHVPESIRFGSIDEKFNFVAAWFNGDGWQDKDGMHWSIHPEHLALDLQLLLSSMGLRSTCDRIDHPAERGRIKSANAVEFIVTISNEYSQLFSDISKAKSRPMSMKSCRRVIPSGDYLFVPVKSVEFVDESTEVFNFSVEDDESYTVHGLVVHNCRVDHDRCSICGAMRKQAGDEHECDHVANHLGELMDDGRKVGTFNDEPQFFDISFVGRPADRIAWNLKVASALDLDSVKYAEYEGVTAPDELACETEASQRKLGYLKDMAALQESYIGWATKQASVVTARDGYLYAFRKVASSQLSDDTVSRLRELPVRHAMGALARNGVIMDVPTFFKYATGDDYEKVVKPYMDQVRKVVPLVIQERVKRAECAQLCNDTTYDAVMDARIPLNLFDSLKKQAFYLGDALLEGAVAPEPELGIDTGVKICLNSGMVEKLAEAYVSYQLSAIDAVVNGRRGNPIRKLDAEALASVNNLRK